VETKFKINTSYYLFRSAESEESLSDLDTSRRNSVEEEQVSKRYLKKNTVTYILAYFPESEDFIL
jgi:hypothetical protein